MPRTNLTFPVGRLLQGDLYKPQTTNMDGSPMVIKTGPNAGQPQVKYYFAVGIPKGAEQHWAQTEWGAKIYKVGTEAFPGGQANSPSFAWKIIDGNSQIPDKTGKRPCDRDGFPGHWIIRFSSGWAPKIYNKDGTAAILEPGAVKLGYYVQVNGDVDGNSSTQTPGVYINHNMVALSAYGTEIYTGPDPLAVGFGQGVTLPAGASAVPMASFTPPVTPMAPAPGTYQPAPTPMPPNPAFMAVPTPPAFLAPPAPVAPVRVMTPKAQGNTYESLIAQGWNDALLVAHGMMAA